MVSLCPHFIAIRPLLAALLLLYFCGNSIHARAGDTSTTSTDITIQVTHPDGKPHGNARAAWYNCGEYGSYDEQSPFEPVPLDNNGKGRLTTALGEQIVVKAWSEDAAPSYRYVDVMGAAALHPVTVAVGPGATIKGQLRSPQGDVRSTGAVRVIYSLHNTRAPFGKRGNYISKVTDSLTTVPLQPDGTFTVTHVPAGNIRLVLDTENYRTADYRWSDTPIGIIDNETTTVEIPVLEVGRLTGIVKDNKGRPIPDVWLAAYDVSSDHRYHSEGNTDANGRFAVSSILPLPFYLNFTIYGAEFFEGPIPGERCNDKNMEITLDLDSETSAVAYAARVSKDASTTKTYEMTGSVSTFPEGELVSLFEVEKSASPYFATSSIEKSTSETGAFTVTTDKPYDDVPVTVSAPGYFPATRRMDKKETNTVHLRKATTMQISVVDAETSRPLPDVEVRGYTAGNLKGFTDDHGTCHFDSFPSGTIRMVLTPPPGHRPAFVYVDTEKGTSVTLALRPGGKIQARLVQQPGAVPLANVDVQYRPLGANRAMEDENTPNVVVYQVTDADGNFTLYDYGSGPAVAYIPRYDLQVTFPWVPSQTTLTRQLELGSAEVRLQSNLRRMATIQASALVGDLVYSLTTDYHRNRYQLVTDMAGNLTLQNLPAGDWTFSFSPLSGGYPGTALREVGPVTIPVDESTVVHASEQLE